MNQVNQVKTKDERRIKMLLLKALNQILKVVQSVVDQLEIRVKLLIKSASNGLIRSVLPTGTVDKSWQLINYIC